MGPSGALNGALRSLSRTASMLAFLSVNITSAQVTVWVKKERRSMVRGALLRERLK